jgi:hypothetical protein
VHETLDGEEGSPAAIVSYFLDGAHTPESMLTCARWFARAAGRDAPASCSPSVSPAPPSQLPTQRVLVFNCTKVMSLAGDNIVQRACSSQEAATHQLSIA